MLQQRPDKHARTYRTKRPTALPYNPLPFTFHFRSPFTTKTTNTKGTAMVKQPQKQEPKESSVQGAPSCKENREKRHGGKKSRSPPHSSLGQASVRSRCPVKGATRRPNKRERRKGPAVPCTVDTTDRARLHGTRRCYTQAVEPRVLSNTEMTRLGMA